MAEGPTSTYVENGLPVQCRLSHRRMRKSGCSNIFTGVNLQQLHRLFRTAGDRDAEHQAGLVWRGMNIDMEGAEESDDVLLAQALVELRVRTRNRAGIRAEGHRDYKWPRASGNLRTEEPLSGSTTEDEEADLLPSQGKFLSATMEDIAENLSPSKPSSWRSDVARQENGQNSERYLHRIIH